MLTQRCLCVLGERNSLTSGGRPSRGPFVRSWSDINCTPIKMDLAPAVGSVIRSDATAREDLSEVKSDASLSHPNTSHRRNSCIELHHAHCRIRFISISSKYLITSGRVGILGHKGELVVLELIVLASIHAGVSIRSSKVLLWYLFLSETDASFGSFYHQHWLVHFGTQKSVTFHVFCCCQWLEQHLWRLMALDNRSSHSSTDLINLSRLKSPNC